jgi:hypothetical protein
MLETCVYYKFDGTIKKMLYEVDKNLLNNFSFYLYMSMNIGSETPILLNL